MAPRRKGYNWYTKNRQDVDNHQIKSLASSRRKLNRNISDNSNVEEWLYCFLGNLAAIEAEKNKSKKLASSIPSHKRRQAVNQRFRSPTPYSWDRMRSKSPVATLLYPTDSDASTGNNHNNSLQKDEIRTKTVRIQDPRSLSDVPIDKASEKHTLLQRINRYIRAGIEEGKRRAKRYVRKALAFALEMGYLVPADSGGRLLRISPTLVNAVKRKQTKTRFIRGKLIKKAAPKKRHVRKNASQANAIPDVKKRKRTKTDEASSSNRKLSNQKLSGNFRRNLSTPLSSSISSYDQQDSVETETGKPRDTRDRLD